VECCCLSLYLWARCTDTLNTCWAGRKMELLKRESALVLWWKVYLAHGTTASDRQFCQPSQLGTFFPSQEIFEQRLLQGDSKMWSDTNLFCVQVFNRLYKQLNSGVCFNAFLIYKLCFLCTCNFHRKNCVSSAPVIFIAKIVFPLHL